MSFLCFTGLNTTKFSLVHTQLSFWAHMHTLIHMFNTAPIRNSMLTLNNYFPCLSLTTMAFYLFTGQSLYPLQWWHQNKKKGKNKKRKIRGQRNYFPSFFKITSLTYSSDSRLPKGRHSRKVLQVWSHRGIISVWLHDEVAYP